MPFHSRERGFSRTCTNEQSTIGKKNEAVNKNSRKHKNKRGGRKHKSENLTIFSTNAAGLKAKMESFKSEISNSKAAIFTIQESHFNKKGKLRLENFEVFEAIRKKQKGGTIIGAHKGLEYSIYKSIVMTLNCS